MRWRLAVLVAITCTIGAGGAPAEAGGGQAPPSVNVNQAPAAAEADGGEGTSTPATRLVAVNAASSGGRTTVTIRGNGQLTPRAVEEARDLPPRVLVDFPGVASGVPAVTPVDSDLVRRVRVAANSESPLVTRVVLDLTRRAPYAVERRADEIVLVIGSLPAAAPAPAPASPVAAAAPVPPASEPVPTSEPAAGARREDATPAPAAADAPAPARREMPAAPAPAAPAVAAPAVTAPAPSPDPATASPDPGRAAAAEADEPAGAGNPEPQPAAQVAEAQQERSFTGHPVSLDFQGVDLRAVLRTFAEITGLNIVIDPSVQGTVDVSLREVPWDQALDIILRANQLGYSVEGNIVRIVPLTRLREEQEEKRKLAEARALSGDLETLTRTLSYAKAEEMVQLLTRAALTQRGSIQVDKRTNTLIIRDLPGGLEASRLLIDSLDTAQPQVEIEARIVQTNRNFLRELGMRWGVQIEASQRLGNPTPLAFPNQIGAEAATSLPTSNPPTSAIGLVMGSVNGAFNLDVELLAAERAGKVRILSTPRVSTQNNVEAEISQGTQIPVQVVANNTVTVTFKDATLTLRVRPQITSANTVIMNVTVENGSPDYTREVNGIPPIDTQRANTQVQVTDGATTVIGGIFVSTERETEDRTPGLHRIPLLGWLFKSDNKSDTSQELLIFLTPRIIKG
jgi:type IV pilus assembly protein PilQ